METVDLPVQQIEARYNTDERSFKKQFAVSLAQDIEKRGLIYPITVRVHPEDKDKFLVVTGRHRFWAMKMVLKWTQVPCFIVEKTDEEAALESIAENVWRTPLNPAQQVKGVKRLLDSQAEENSAMDPREFNKKIAGITRQASSSIRRTKQIANAFSHDELEVFDAMGSSKNDMMTLALIKDQEQRRRAVSMVAGGLEPLAAARRVTGDPEFKSYLERTHLKTKEREKAQTAKTIEKTEKTDENLASGTDAPPRPRNGLDSEVVEREGDQAEPPMIPEAVEPTDEEWLSTHCSKIRSFLVDPSRFDGDALLYRRISESRRAFRTAVKADLAKAKVGPHGPLYGLLTKLVDLSHPKDWTICLECRGQGMNGATGYDRCPVCFGAGYQIRKEKYF